MKQISIRKNYIYRLTYEVLQVIIGVVTVPYISRVLGAEGVGVYSYTSSIMAYFTLFAALGTKSYGTKEIAQHRDNKVETTRLFWGIEVMTIITSLVCLAGWIGIICLSVQYKYIYIALIPNLIATMMDISWFFTGLEQIQLIVIQNSISKILGIVLLFLLVKTPNDVFLYTLINSMIVLIGSASMWVYLPRMLVKTTWKELGIKNHFKATIVYFIPTLATSIYTILDKTLLGVITKDAYQNGYYEQATKIISVVKTFVYTAVNSVIGARSSYLFSQKKYDQIRKMIEKSMDFILLLGVGSVFGICGIATRFVPLFLGAGYEPVITLVRIMSPIVIIVGISNCLGSQLYTPGGQISRSSKVIVLGASINLLFNLILIPILGSVGATIATLIAESVITILYINMSNGYMTFGCIWHHLRKKIVAGIIMCIVVINVGNFVKLSMLKTVLLQVLLGIILYLGILIISKDKSVLDVLDIIVKKDKK